MANIPASLTTDLFAWMSALRAAIIELNTYIEKSCEYQTGALFDLPRIKRADEIEPYTTIPVTPIFDEEDVVLRCRRAYLDFYGQGDESTRAVYRLPGYQVITPSSFITLMAKVDKVNFLKKQYDLIMQPITNEEQRFEVVHACFPMLIIKQATRPIILVNGQLRSISFTWATKTSIYKRTRDDVIDKLYVALKYPNPRIKTTNFTWDEIINREIQMIQQYPANTEFRQKFINKTRPLANLRFTGGLKRQRAASIPLIIWHPDPSKFIRRQLKPFNAETVSAKAKIKGSVNANKTVLEHYNLYLHEEGR